MTRKLNRMLTGILHAYTYELTLFSKPLDISLKYVKCLLVCVNFKYDGKTSLYYSSTIFII
jgi:hypothetical protein